MSTQHVFGQVFGMESWIAAAVFAAVVLIVVLASYRYRDRPGREVSTVTKANAVETGFALALFAFAVFLTVDTASADHREAKPAGVAPLHVDVLAYQWNWRFTYPGQSITVDGGPVGHRPTLVVPVGRPVEISLRSKDVVHEFWVPDLDYKMQAFPNHVNHFTITATKAGTWVGRCAVFCGQFHFEMDFLLQAVNPHEFSAWSAAHQGASI